MERVHHRDGRPYRVFQGHETKQIDGHTGAPAQDGAWHFEPADYDGDVLWSAPCATFDEACLLLEYEQE